MPRNNFLARYNEKIVLSAAIRMAILDIVEMLRMFAPAALVAAVLADANAALDLYAAVVVALLALMILRSVFWFFDL